MRKLDNVRNLVFGTRNKTMRISIYILIMILFACNGCNKSNRSLYASQGAVFDDKFNIIDVDKAYDNFASYLSTNGFREVSKHFGSNNCEMVFQGAWQSWSNISISLEKSIEIRNHKQRIIVTSKIRTEKRPITPTFWNEWEDLTKKIKNEWSNIMVFSPNSQQNQIIHPTQNDDEKRTE